MPALPAESTVVSGDLSGLRLHRSYSDGVDDIFCLAASGEIVGRLIETLENWPNRGGARQPFGEFVRYVAGLEIGKD